MKLLLKKRFTPKIAIVGLGAITTNFYLPLLKKSNNWQITHLVDDNPDAINDPLFKNFKGKFLTDYSSIPMDQIDAVIVATPNHSHFPIASHLLEHDTSVLVEKPVALSSDNYKLLKNKQMPKGPILYSGMVKRCLPIYKVLKEIFRHKLLGDLKAFNLEEGMNFNWPIRSLSFLDKEKAGGGILIDYGIHSLDLLFWWLQSSGQLPELTSFKYQDDDQGGVEAECRIQLSFESGLSGNCQFSRLRPLSQSWRLDFEKGSITLKKGKVFLSLQKGLEKHSLIKQLRSIKRRTLRYAFQEQLKVFQESVKYGRQEDDPVIPYTITLINQLYAHRQTLTSSYYQFTQTL